MTKPLTKYEQQLQGKYHLDPSSQVACRWLKGKIEYEHGFEVHDILY